MSDTSPSENGHHPTSRSSTSEALGRLSPLLVVLPRSLIHYRQLEALEIPMRRVIFVLLALTTGSHAQSVVFTYDQWEKLSAGLQEIYVAGAFDALSTIATPVTAGSAKYYNDCVVK